jgi:hypothetical protein
MMGWSQVRQLLVYVILILATATPLSTRWHMGLGAELDFLGLVVVPPLGYAWGLYRRRPRNGAPERP